MVSRPVSVRMPPETRAAIDELARRTGRDFSSVTNEMLAEAVRTRRIPGIVFVDGPSGRVARIGGSGLDVWEVIAEYRRLDQDTHRLRQMFHWLTDIQLRAALAYAAAYPEEIEAAIRDDASWTPERVWTTFPFAMPPTR